jgi:hypothetical protein
MAMAAQNIAHGEIMNKSSFSSFFFIFLLIFTLFPPMVFAQPLTDFKVNDYAKYTIAAAELFCTNLTKITADKSQESTLTWTITDVTGSNFTVDLSLHIPVLSGDSLDFTFTMIVVDRTAYFNGTEWGYFPFWINSAMNLDETLSISGNADMLVTGTVTSDTQLKETSSGWQQCYIVKSDSHFIDPRFTIAELNLAPSEYEYDIDSVF